MRAPERLLLALCLAACGSAEEAPGDAAAECNIPSRIELPAAASLPDDKPDAPAAAYVLAMSWSPEFCRFRKDARAHEGQCADNDFDFILHGLWVDSAAGPSPRACAVAPPVGEALVRQHYCMMPSAQLMQHQWAAHGTCAFSSAEAYLGASKSLWDGVKRPDLRALRGEPLTAGSVRAAFVQGNIGLPPEAIAVTLNNRGWLTEVRLCMDLDYNYAACRNPGAADGAAVLIWRGG
ncbi:ribonuclease T2 family protein [Sphingosinicella soli]|uniref:Ribonuclease T2 n=1 Tax=Sphingosinicella soli TaxID=333708 RepID=A0A7W7B5L6_9SPHN|nr:ribonuclease T [Sphingosinicella soli]MBB4633525.1 ribonuclease T2 [Sphingosinicella soli]